jgi:hypothetical protein
MVSWESCQEARASPAKIRREVFFIAWFFAELRRAEETLGLHPLVVVPNF